MSMFENKTKPELEAGNFIAYADEPNTVVSGSGGGGGGGGGDAYDVMFVVLPDDDVTNYQTTPFFKIDDVEISGFESMPADDLIIYAKTYSVNADSLITITNVTGFSPLGELYGCFECKLVGDIVLDNVQSLAFTMPENAAVYYAENNTIDENIPPNTVAIVRTMYKESL